MWVHTYVLWHFRSMNRKPVQLPETKILGTPLYRWWWYCWHRGERAHESFSSDFIHRIYSTEGKNVFTTKFNVIGEIQEVCTALCECVTKHSDFIVPWQVWPVSWSVVGVFSPIITDDPGPGNISLLASCMTDQLQHKCPACIIVSYSVRSQAVVHCRGLKWLHSL